jgi:hypothetical protein
LIEQLRDAAATGRSLIHADVLMERAADALAAGANILAARDAEVARLRAVLNELVAADSESIPDEDRVEAAWHAAIAALAQPREPT